ncbi:type II and III secretion system protein family protein [Labrys wisconsinensis]|uniref:Pilus assembly protein CpaC n=1 Tax=Labrys wisconsinensis TaxID=425677 RepID=A0ABU0JDQ5_9HYPH|nr:type II and III secretion system protein family protein [Labrys wisconsinensis]MDQ0472413.1 pilus assembly protein CpaC [Labrys wisconsinensis]
MLSQGHNRGRQGRAMRLVLILAAALLAGGLAAAPAAAQTNLRIGAGEGETTRRVDIGLGKSIIVDLPRDAKEVFVANPQVANAVVRSARKVFVTAAGVGQTTLVFMDLAGNQMSALDINVQRDISPIARAIQEAVPGSEIVVRQLNEGVLLSGYVNSADDASRAVAIASQFLGKDGAVANSISIRAREQVMLKVTVAEVQRQILKQLGIDLAGGNNSGTFTFSTSNPFGLAGPIASNTASIGNSNFNATIRAFERANVLRTLAEPTLTAISGESAKFLAGGEFPILTSSSCTPATAGGVPICQTGYTYKQFGVGLTFTPVVLNEGRISLKVGTEVSDIDNKNTFTTTDGAVIPAFTVRRADTTVELASGASLVMAGMIQQNTKQVVNGTPGLMNIPILGQLFRSRDYQRDNTELMIMVTPYLAKAVDRKDIALPSDGFTDASDPSTFLLGRFNKIYGVRGAPAPTGKLAGRYGFTVD